MKNFIPRFLIVIILGILFIYHDMTHLSKNELEWTECAVKYPKVNFISNYGHHSTLEYGIRRIFNSVNPINFSENTNVYDASSNYIFKISQQNGDILDGFFSISKLTEDRKLHFSFIFGHLITELFNTPLLITSDVVINNCRYNDCIIVNTNNLAEGIIERDNSSNKHIKIKKFIISKEFGLIYYQLENGEEFFSMKPELYKIIE